MSTAVEMVLADEIDGKIELAAHRDLDAVGILTHEYAIYHTGDVEGLIDEAFGVAALIVELAEFILGEGDQCATAALEDLQLIDQGEAFETEGIIADRLHRLIDDIILIGTLLDESHKDLIDLGVVAVDGKILSVSDDAGKNASSSLLVDNTEITARGDDSEHEFAGRRHGGVGEEDIAIDIGAEVMVDQHLIASGCLGHSTQFILARIGIEIAHYDEPGLTDETSAIRFILRIDGDILHAGEEIEGMGDGIGDHDADLLFADSLKEMIEAEDATHSVAIGSHMTSKDYLIMLINQVLKRTNMFGIEIIFHTN